MHKVPSKRRVKARLRIGREVTFVDLTMNRLFLLVVGKKFKTDHLRQTVRRVL